MRAFVLHPSTTPVVTSAQHARLPRVHPADPKNKHRGKLPTAALSATASGAFTVTSSLCNRARGRTILRQSPKSDPIALQEEEKEDKWGERFNWHKAWYPMAVLEDLDPGRPSKVELLGEELVVWRDGEKQWRVFEDRCPHRNVPLSEGRVESDGTLMCSYHGWRFSGTGMVTQLPQAKEEDLPRLLANPRACAAVRPSVVKHGILWVWGESSPDAALESALVEPNLPRELVDPAFEGRATCDTWSHRDVPYGWEVAMENVTDPSHVSVAHHNIVSNRYEDPSPLKIDWVRKPSNKDGFEFRTTALRKLKPEEVGLVTTFHFKPPTQMNIKTTFPTGASRTLVIHFVPTKPGWSRLVGTTMFVKGDDGKAPKGFAFAAGLPRWLLHLLGPMFLHQDQVFLHFQQSILQKEMLKEGITWKKSYWIPTEADKGTVALRQWLDRNGGIAWSPGVATELSALPQKELLFDTYKTHTSVCTTCQTALKRVSQTHSVLKYSALIVASAGLTSLSWPILAGGCALGLGAGATHKLKRMFYEFPFHHQDNN